MVPEITASSTTQRLLTLLSLLQSQRDWPSSLIADRLGVTDRTVRRDVERLRELGYVIVTTRGPDGGYRLGTGERLPPLLLDDEQAIALAIALRTAAVTATGIEDTALRALQSVSRLMPERLARRVEKLEVGAVASGGAAPRAGVDPAILLRIGEAIRAGEELRFDYDTPARDAEPAPIEPRRTEPHHVLLSGGRWYLIGWARDRDDWRVYRVDRVRLRQHTGRRFTPREVPGGPSAFLTARFRGSDHPGASWPCHGSVVLRIAAREVAPFAGDGVVEALGPDLCRFTGGSWSWESLAALIARFGVDIESAEPGDLRDAFGVLAARFTAIAPAPTSVEN